MSSHYYTTVDDLPNIMYQNPAITEKLHTQFHDDDDDYEDGNESIFHYYQQHNKTIDSSGTSYFQIHDTSHDPFQEYKNHRENNPYYYYDDLDATSDSSLSLELEDDGDERVYYEKENPEDNEQQQEQHHNLKTQRRRWSLDINNKNSILHQLFSSIHQRDTATIKTVNTTRAIPLEYRSASQWIHREWEFFCFTLFLNFLANLAIFFDPPVLLKNSMYISLVIALVEGVLYSFASYFVWKRPVCNAYMTDDSVHRTLFLAFNAVHIIFTTYKLIGVPTSGSAGIVLLFILFSEGGSIVTIVLTLLASISWLSLLGLSLYLYKETYKHFRSI
ncbi:scamp family-domain-containing protein [Phascolomyces articulosus]|uniref:Scamp family-domain-containing protein n=1 Tax=Phascolomyces articulosus TaxID=60185 RepID=A0AAD5JY01_9FUNG|nr:scamp family-domain-containing protein [Phascolomyces articulosus]